MEDYYNKYAKYKIKYMNLKNQKGGNDCGNICGLNTNSIGKYISECLDNKRNLLKGSMEIETESKKLNQ